MTTTDARHFHKPSTAEHLKAWQFNNFPKRPKLDKFENVKKRHKESTSLDSSITLVSLKWTAV